MGSWCHNLQTIELPLPPAAVLSRYQPGRVKVNTYFLWDTWKHPLGRICCQPSTSYMSSKTHSSPVVLISLLWITGDSDAILTTQRFHHVLPKKLSPRSTVVKSLLISKLDKRFFSPGEVPVGRSIKCTPQKLCPLDDHMYLIRADILQLKCFQQGRHIRVILNGGFHNGDVYQYCKGFKSWIHIGRCHYIYIFTNCKLSSTEICFMRFNWISSMVTCKKGLPQCHVRGILTDRICLITKLIKFVSVSLQHTAIQQLNQSLTFFYFF